MMNRSIARVLAETANAQVRGLAADPLGAGGTAHARDGTSPRTGGARRSWAFTLVEVMIVVSILSILVMVAMPSLLRARTSTQIKSCILNLRAMDDAKQRWALEAKKLEGEKPSKSDIVPYLQPQRMPVCPGGGSYRLQRLGRNPYCSLWRSGHTVQNLDMDADPDPD